MCVRRAQQQAVEQDVRQAEEKQGGVGLIKHDSNSIYFSSLCKGAAVFSFLLRCVNRHNASAYPDKP